MSKRPFSSVARQLFYLNIVKQELGHEGSTECLAADSGAVTKDESDSKAGTMSTVAAVLLNKVERAADLAGKFVNYPIKTHYYIEIYNKSCIKHLSGTLLTWVM